MPKKLFPFEGKGRDNLLTFSAGAALNDTGEEMYAPYLSYYASRLLGVSPAQYGIIEGVTEAINRILRGITGSLADRWGRKAPVVLGYILIAFSRLGLALVTGWLGFIPMRGLRQVGRALRDPAREASIADTIPQNQRGKAFGLLNSVDTMGAIIGPVIGLLILASVVSGYLTFRFASPDPVADPAQREALHSAYLWLFMWASIPTIISGWIIWLFLKETRPRDFIQPVPLTRRRWRDFLKPILQNVRVYIANKPLFHITLAHMALAISAVPLGMIFYYVYGQTDKSGQITSGIGGDPTHGSILFIIYAVVHFATSYPAGIIVDRLGRYWSQLLGNILLIVSLFIIAFTHSPYVMIVPLVLYACFESIWITARRSIVADLAPAGARGQTLGTFSMLYGLTSLLSPILLGTLWTLSTPTFAFCVMGIIGIGATILLITTRKYARHSVATP